MIAVLYLLVYLGAGCMIVRCLLPRHRVLNRIWLGMSLGLLLLMWLPALCAFAMKFTLTAHWAALILLALVCGGCFLLRDKRSPVRWDEEEKKMLIRVLAVCIPLTILSGYLQYTHNMRVDEYGNWNVGQSTYGDLPMHMSFITGLCDSSFPPEYPFYPGHQLSYPFLTDSLSTSLYMMGFSLQAALAVPGTLMMALCYFGFMVLSREMTAGKKTIILAALLFFLNGGLGFLYDFDQAAGYESDGTLTVIARIKNILEGYYKTPTNQPDPNNLRWSNVIADLMIPQRTLLGGWTMLIPCFYLMYTGYAPEKRTAHGGIRQKVLLGVWGGLMPLIHTHSFAALALSSAGMMLYDLIHEKEKAKIFRSWLLYGLIAAVLALPQLILFTFSQTFQQAGTEGSGNSFIVFQFNWVNNPSGSGMRDFYFWFYIKNIGLPFIALILALFEKDKRERRIFAGAFAIILAAELIRFQPNEYDNNKLFYPAYMLCCMIIADFAAKVWRKLKGLRCRGFLAAVTAVVVFLSAGLTLWRECVSSYEAFSADDVETAEWIEDNTDEDAVFLTGATYHLNPVTSIAGRTIVCGPDLWLYWHGFDTSARKQAISAFYADPESNLDLLLEYDVDYIYVSAYELTNYTVNLDALDDLFTIVYEGDSATVWKVPEG